MRTKIAVTTVPLVVLDIELPEGWHRVWRGVVKPGDRYLHCGALRRNHTLFWDDVPPIASADDPYLKVMTYLCVIRPGAAPVDIPCEHCEYRARRHGERFCGPCGRRIVREMFRS